MATKTRISKPTYISYDLGDASAFETYETSHKSADKTTGEGISFGAVPEDDPDARLPIQDVQTFELASGDSTEVLDVRGCKNLIAVTDGNAKWEVPSEDGTFYDFHVMTSQSQTATTNVGVVSADAMPPYIRLTDTSSSANTVTIYARF